MVGVGRTCGTIALAARRVFHEEMIVVAGCVVFVVVCGTVVDETHGAPFAKVFEVTDGIFGFRC